MTHINVCSVCEENDHKYKCPTCLKPYCSVSCWNRHKSSRCSPPADGKEKSEKRTIYFPTEDTVPLEALSRLRDSPGVKRVLSNPHVRAILESVDSSKDPSSSMKTAMQEPIFVEFVDECLKIVEPQED